MVKCQFVHTAMLSDELVDVPVDQLNKYELHRPALTSAYKLLATDYEGQQNDD